MTPGRNRDQAIVVAVIIPGAEDKSRGCRTESFLLYLLSGPSSLPPSPITKYVGAQ